MNKSLKLRDDVQEIVGGVDTLYKVEKDAGVENAARERGHTNQEQSAILDNRFSHRKMSDNLSYDVVISSSGRTTYLIELIESVLAQTCKARRVFVLLDANIANADCSRALKTAFCTMSVEIMMLEGMNLPMKRNYGLELSKADVVMFSDDDDVWKPHKAECVLRYLDEGYSAVCHNYSLFGSVQKHACHRLGSKSKKVPYWSIAWGDNIWGGGSAMCCKRSVLEVIRFDETLSSCEDLDWWLRVQIATNSVFYIGEPLVDYRRHSTNMISNGKRMASTLRNVALESFAKSLFQIVGSILMLLRSLFRSFK